MKKRHSGHSVFRRLRVLCLLLSLILASGSFAQAGFVDWEELFGKSGWYDDSARPETEESSSAEESEVSEEGVYTSREEVAEYLHRYGHLPDNFITKAEAKKLGWISSEGNLDEVAPGKSIGGDYFGNYEGQLPEKKGRTYRECDIDYTGGYRGGKRIIYSDDGLIYYTEDHYQTFELVYDAK